MAVDTPAKIAILGAGPIGLEAALYARFLGYEVEVFEHVTIGGTSGRTRFRERKMPTRFGENSSRLGLAAISTQNPELELPLADEFLRMGEWFDRYVKPLSTVDLLDGAIRFETQVLSIGKVELSKIDVPTNEFDRGAWDFRLLFQRLHSSDFEITTADVVLDCTGTQPAFIGHGGLPPAGKLYSTYEFDYHPCDADGDTVLVVGDHPSAANAILTLVNLKGDYPDTNITWITPRERTECVKGPFNVLNNAPASSYIAELKQANECALNGQVEWRPGTWLEAIHPSQSGYRGFEVQTSGEHESIEIFDRVISHNGVCPDWQFTTELQLDICPITDAPRPFSEYLLKRPSPYSVEYPAPDASALITSEPNYYVLGSKSFGRMPGFLYQHGLRQIRDVFTIIGDRADLDLYAQMK